MKLLFRLIPQSYRKTLEPAAKHMKVDVPDWTMQIRNTASHRPFENDLGGGDKLQTKGCILRLKNEIEAWDGSAAKREAKAEHDKQRFLQRKEPNP